MAKWGNRAYRIEYLAYECAEIKAVIVYASNKEEAYEKAYYEAIPAREGGIVYAAWVESVRMNNGKFKRFNTFAGKPY